MKPTLEQITKELGESWVEDIKTKALIQYESSHWNARDLSKTEYVNSMVRHAYDNLKEPESEGAD